MQELEPFDHSEDSQEDLPESSLLPDCPEPEVCDSASEYVDGTAAAPRKFYIHWPTACIAVLFCAVVALASVVICLSMQQSGSGVALSTSAQSDGANDDFAVNVDPDSSSDSDESTAQETDSTSPSNIDRYTGDATFTLELQSSAGKSELTKQEVYAQVAPSVVTITVYGDTSGAYATGIILSEDGFILTNQHVVGGENSAQVTTNDERTYAATLVGEDANTDLAVLKIEATGLTPAEFGRSDELLVGDDCYAIGNPLGITYRGTFTDGIISALNRNVSLNGYTMTLIQTTAALNSGNSGGPLINCYGQVIGVNNMKIMSSSTTVEGLGFAIPSTTAQEVTNALISTGVVEHPVIGITCYSTTASATDGTEIDGVYVATVSANSDAAAKGLAVGDIITAVNGVPCATVSDVGTQMKGLGVGDSLTLTVWRDGAEFTVDVALVEQNDMG
jgi:serine protease Do